MNTLIVDDKQLAINALKKILERIDPNGVHSGTLSASDAILFLEQNKVDVVFLDIEMPRTNGLILAKKIKEMCGDTNIIFVTGYSEYALEAHQLYVSGFLTKPAEEEDVRMALENLRHPIVIPRKNRLQIQCFGNFEVFVDGIALHFSRSKTKEMFAVLVDRQGATCTNGELLDILWENKLATRSQYGQLRNLIHDLRNVLIENHAESVLVRNRNTIAINKNLVDCDFYDFLKNNPYAVNLYHGEYMKQYSWAEMTTASIHFTNAKVE